jgi:hypothetical protein
MSHTMDEICRNIDKLSSYNFYVPRSNGPLVVDVKQKTKNIFTMRPVLSNSTEELS